MSGRSALLVRFFVFATVALTGFTQHASAVTLDSVSHIHHVKVIENKVLVLTHEGLFELVGKNEMKLIGKDRIDVMGFTSLEIVANRHIEFVCTSSCGFIHHTL